jgi:ribokinase
MSVAVVGAYTKDLYMFGPRLPGPGETVDCPEYAESHGGKAANQAVAAARLGAQTSLITLLGNDRMGDDAFALLASEGLDMTYVRRNDKAGTGVGFIILDQDGLQIITTYAGASGQLTRPMIRQAESMLKEAYVLLLQGEISAEISLYAAQLAGKHAKVILDPGPVEPFLGIGGLDEIDIIVPNQQEAATLTGKANPSPIDVQIATGVPNVIITLGAAGIEIFQGGDVIHIPAPPAQVVDTTGAGDAFNGAIAAGLDRGLDLISASEHACRCASFSVERRFCIPSFPTYKDIPWPDDVLLPNKQL